MAANNLDSSLEPDIPVEVSQASSDQRPSVISLGTKSRGLPGLLTADGSRASNEESNSLHRESLHGIVVEHHQSSEDNHYNITEFTEGGFIIGTNNEGYEPGEEESSGDEGSESDREALSPTNSDSNEATSEYRRDSGQTASTLSPPNVSIRDARRDSNVFVMSAPSPGHDMSGSSSDDSLSAFDRQGHQGSFVLRKDVRRTRALSPYHPTGSEGNDIRHLNVVVTPIQSLDQSQQGLADFGSSSDESQSEAFERDKKHRSLVLKKGKRKKMSAPPTDTIYTNHGVVTVSTEEEGEGEDPEADVGTVLHPDIRDRVKRSLQVLNSEDKSEAGCDPTKCFPYLKNTEPTVPYELNQMKRLGFKMAPKFFFPALPKLLQDIWIATELFITFFEFAFACVTFTPGSLISILVIALTFLNIILASIDSFLYFINRGSCATLFKWSYKRLKNGTGSIVKEKLEQTDEGGERQDTSCFGHFQKQTRKVFATGSEVIRIAITELLLYPLTVLDIFELIDSQTYRFNSRDDRINFSLLNIGLFYLVLTIYLIRILMSVSAIVSISRLPKTTSSSYHNLLKKFALHLIFQIFVHMAILVMVSTKIDSELCESIEGSGFQGSGFPGNETTSISVNASPFLYVTIITGDVIPFLGVAMFFVVNYPALKTFMMGFCIDMMSTIVSEDFAGTAFEGKGVRKVKKRASNAYNEVTLAVARKQYTVYRNVFSFKKKLAYRLTNPFVVILSAAYFTLITVFLVCHVLGWSDPCEGSNSTVRFITFNDHQGAFITFIVGLIAIAIANYQVVSISMIWLVAIPGLVLLVVTLPFVALVLAALIAIIVLVKFSI